MFLGKKNRSRETFFRINTVFFNCIWFVEMTYFSPPPILTGRLHRQHPDPREGGLQASPGRGGPPALPRPFRHPPQPVGVEINHQY